MTSTFFTQYRQDFSARPPLPREGDLPDAMDDLTGEPDCFTLTPSPFQEAVSGRPPQCKKDPDAYNQYLWLIRREDVQVALEEGETGRATGRKRLAHTNFTGGAPAWCGGELWFREQAVLWLNGCSGRYPPRNKAEFDAIVAALQAAGYTVCCAVWDDDINGTLRFFSGEEMEHWLAPPAETEHS